MSNVIKTAIVGAVAAAFVASVAVAQQGPGPGRQRGIGPGGPGGPGGRGFGPAIMQDLTPEQREQIRAIHEEMREQGGPADAKLRHALEMELLADTPNDQKIEELKQEILSAQAEGLTRHITAQKRVAQVLTAEQRGKARERLAQGPPERGGRRGGQGFGPRR